MLKIIIDNFPVEVEAGVTILDAARLAGVEIPTLCHLRGLPAATSCLVCLVKVQGRARYLPSCATKVEDGMVVRAKRRRYTRRGAWRWNCCSATIPAIAWGRARASARRISTSRPCCDKSPRGSRGKRSLPSKRPSRCPPRWGGQRDGRLMVAIASRGFPSAIASMAGMSRAPGRCSGTAPIAGMVAEQQLQRHAPRRVISAVSLHHHAVFHLRGTGGRVARPALFSGQPGGGDGGQPAQMAEGGFHRRQARGVEDGRAVFHLDRKLSMIFSALALIYQENAIINTNNPILTAPDFDS